MSLHKVKWLAGGSGTVWWDGVPSAVAGDGRTGCLAIGSSRGDGEGEVPGVAFDSVVEGDFVDAVGVGVGCFCVWLTFGGWRWSGQSAGEAKGEGEDGFHFGNDRVSCLMLLIDEMDWTGIYTG